MFPNDSSDNDEAKPQNSSSPESSEPQAFSPRPFSQAVQNETVQPSVNTTVNPVTNQPADPNTPLPDASTMFQASTPIATPKKSRKKLLVTSLLSILVIGGLAGYVFGLYIPSKPENMYSKAMDRSGQALDKVMIKVTDKAELDRYKKGQYDGSLKVNFDPFKIDGKMALKYDNSRLDFNGEAKVSEDGQTEKTYKTQFLTELKDGSTYPDIYFIITGIKDLGLESFAPGIEKLDQTWIKVDEAYIKDLIESLQSTVSSGGDTDDTSKPPELTNDDVSELSKVFSGVVKEYVLTDDTTKSILVNKQFVGKEKSDGLNTYHYVIGINKDNYEKACIESANRLFDTSAYKKLTESTEEDIKTTKEDAKKGCEESKKEIKDDETFDMWIDAKYKLIYKIRDYDDENKDDYVEIGQKYKGGDDLHFFVNYEGKKDKFSGKFTLDMNTKTLVSRAKIDVKSDGEDGAGTFELTVDGKPLDGDITIEKPSNPKSIQQVIEELGLNSGEELLDPLGVDASDPFSIDPAFEL